MFSSPNQFLSASIPSNDCRWRTSRATGNAPAKKIRHAQVLLMSDHDRPGGKMTGPEIAVALGMHLNTVARIRKRFVLEGDASRAGTQAA